MIAVGRSLHVRYEMHDIHKDATPIRDTSNRPQVSTGTRPGTRTKAFRDVLPFTVAGTRERVRERRGEKGGGKGEGGKGGRRRRRGSGKGEAREMERDERRERVKQNIYIYRYIVYACIYTTATKNDLSRKNSFCCHLMILV
jgi:hypothetical protein